MRTLLLTTIYATGIEAAPASTKSISKPSQACTTSISLSPTACSRRAVVGGISSAAAAIAGSSRPEAAFADLASAGANGLPLLGRFEPLRGASSFIGEWQICSTVGPPDGPSAGVLTFQKDGDVVLRSADGKAMLGVSAAPWVRKLRGVELNARPASILYCHSTSLIDPVNGAKLAHAEHHLTKCSARVPSLSQRYVSPKSGETLVKVSFTMDAVEVGDVLYYEATVDSALGPERELRGSIETGFGRRVGSFTASPVPV